MQKLFFDTRTLDAVCRERYALTEEIMMENAATALERAVLAEKDGPVLILCGTGNNGADGYALARRLQGIRNLCLIACGAPKSPLCKTQAKRAKKTGILQCNLGQKLKKKKDVDSPFFAGDGSLESLLSLSALVVDCIFGSGFHGELADDIRELLEKVNDCEGVKIACDLPTGLSAEGILAAGSFRADKTITMGALKSCLYSDQAKDFTGKIICENLGVSRTHFENAAFDEKGEFLNLGEKSHKSKNEVEGIGLVAAASQLREKMGKVSPQALLLEESDLILPVREKNLVNKGSFGHAAVVCGQKPGAACMAGDAALSFGAGLVTLVRLPSGLDKKELPQVNSALMTGSEFPANTSALALGMGLGRPVEDHPDSALIGGVKEPAASYLDWLSQNEGVGAVLDADIFYSHLLKDFLQKRSQKIAEEGAASLVLTPHPKEFQSLLALCGLGNYSVEECLNRRLELVDQFCRSYPGLVLLVKGANPLIGLFEEGKMKAYINPLGSAALAKAGSGDVLSGLIVSLLAQGRSALDSAINASLAHALASQKVKQNYALTPALLIENLGQL